MPAEAARVAYVLKMYPRLAETFILNELLAHERQGLDIDLVSLRSPVDGRFHADLARIMASVTYLPGPSVKAPELWRSVHEACATMPGGDRFFAESAMEEAGDVYQAVLLARFALERGITHLHAHFATAATTVARMASVLTGIPYSFTAHAKDIFHESVVAEDLRRKLRQASSVVTVSDFNVEFLRDQFGEDASNVVRIYNGLDLDQYPYREYDDRPPLILGVGRLVDKKGFGDLITACDVLRTRGTKFRCEIVGTGVLEQELAAQIEARDLADVVTMLGARSRDEVITRMSSAAILSVPCVVSPSGNRDGLPTVLLEAMAVGTPCVSTPVTGIPEAIVDGETGLLVPEQDPAALADAMARLLNDHALARQIARDARALIEREFDIDVNTPRIRELFTGARAPVGVAG